ncbi:efflux RND transporter permease subunit, partial [Butyricicoccus sp. 1XD8-22]
VANVNVTGKLIEEINITLDQSKLKQYNLAQSDIVNLIQANNISMPGETVLTDGKELTTRIVSSLHSAKEIEKLVITVNPRTGDKIRIRDVADVKQQKQD